MVNRRLTIALLDEIQDAFNQHDVNRILLHFTDNCEWLMARGPNEPEGRRCSGKVEIGNVLRARYEIIPDMRWEDICHWICDDEKAISEWIVCGTPKDGKSFRLIGCDLWEFSGGFITKKDTYWKSIQ